MSGFEEWYKDARVITAEAGWNAAWNEQQKKIDAIKDLFKGYECGPELAAFENKIMEIIKCGKT